MSDPTVSLDGTSHSVLHRKEWVNGKTRNSTGRTRTQNTGSRSSRNMSRSSSNTEIENENTMNKTKPPFPVHPRKLVGGNMRYIYSDRVSV